MIDILTHGVKEVVTLPILLPWMEFPNFPNDIPNLINFRHCKDPCFINAILLPIWEYI